MRHDCRQMLGTDLCRGAQNNQSSILIRKRKPRLSINEASVRVTRVKTQGLSENPKSRCS